jgi:iron(III) transport system permease protein
VGPATAGVAALVVLALGVPVGAVLELIIGGGNQTLPPASILDAAGNTFFYSAAAGVLATVAAVPISLLVTRHPGRLPTFLERTNYLVLAVPGVVIALAVTYVSERYAQGFLYHSALLLILTYAVMFFPMALVSVRASIARAPAQLEEVARSLGAGRLEAWWRVTAPLVAPGLAAAFSLVFLEAATELTATLILIPTGAQTLATQFWVYESNLSYAQAAPYAGVMMLLAAVPSVVLGRWFDRLPARAAQAAR